MKIFRIDVSNKIGSFDKMYEQLDEIGKYIVYFGNFVVITEKEDITEIFKDEEDISIFEITDIEKQIEKPFVRNWVAEELIKEEILRAKNEVDERTKALYDIIVNAKEKYKELEEGSSHNGNEQE